MQELILENSNLRVFDMVSYYGIENSLKNTAECLKNLCDDQIINHIKQYLVWW